MVVLNFAAPSEVAAGATSTFSLLYTNSSTVALRNASLMVTLPADVFLVGQPQGEQTETVSLGDIAAGSSGKQDFTLLSTAEAGSIVQVSSTLSYTTDASPSKSFSASNIGSIAVGAPIIELAISTPANVFAGQNFTTKISYKNTTGQTIDGVEITMQYPQGFSFAQATPTPILPGDTSWNIGSLAAGAQGTILIAGNVTGENTALYSISGSATESVSGGSYTVTAEAANVAITAPPLMIGAVLNDDPSYVAGLNDSLDYRIMYANTTDTTFQNVVVTATLEGGMFDLTSVQSNAAFNSRTNTLTWYVANTPALAAVTPGTSSSLDIKLKTESSFPITSATDKDFTLGLHLTINSPTVPAGTVATSTSASADVVNKVGGVVAVNTVGYRYETGQAIENSGPYPPQVNQQTTYTIHWLVTNYSTDVKNVNVSAYLQSGASCTGEVTSTIASVPVCDLGTGEVTWTIPSLSAGTGVIGAPAEAVFQVANVPAVTQLGQAVPLLGETSLTATDGFTGATLSASANSIDTSIPEDGAVTTNNRNVTQ